MWAAEAAFARSGSWREEEDEQEALRWAALQRLPTVARARRGLLRSPAPGEERVQGDDALCEVDVAGLSPGDRTALVDRLLADSGDVEDFFRRIRSRFDASVPHCSLSLSPCLSARVEASRSATLDTDMWGPTGTHPHRGKLLEALCSPRSSVGEVLGFQKRREALRPGAADTWAPHASLAFCSLASSDPTLKLSF